MLPSVGPLDRDWLSRLVVNKRKEEQVQFDAALHRDFCAVFDCEGRGALISALTLGSTR
jgi:hypothetical protein